MSVRECGLSLELTTISAPRRSSGLPGFGTTEFGERLATEATLHQDARPPPAGQVQPVPGGSGRNAAGRSVQAGQAGVAEATHGSWHTARPRSRRSSPRQPGAVSDRRRNTMVVKGCVVAGSRFSKRMVPGVQQQAWERYRLTGDYRDAAEAIGVSRETVQGWVRGGGRHPAPTRPVWEGSMSEVRGADGDPGPSRAASLVA